MIISHKYKFIFLKTAKTAGTSLEIALSRFCGENDIITPIVEEDEAIRKSLGYPGPQNYKFLPITAEKKLFKEPKSMTFYNHISAREIRSWLHDEIWDEYYKFCFERNPWERVISLYYHYISYLTEEEKLLSFSDFINLDLITGLRQWGFNIYTINNEIVVNKVYLYENLEAELENIFLQLNLPGKILLPRAKGTYRKDKKSSKIMFNQKEIEKIAQLFEKEIKLFGYKI
ncbi:sulfotransferase family 2 domain-containing protein [Crocosphaera sp. XPORK-15E]|uniref:sulfotransferase family 2 domain-containing protein n=1 Tax=Crocosphaera sp. XPORK-15E TaxID=3110247 RepID=UPI002B215E1A|nr:sulfotransferase family 2 domain-containing protein [Crocosphaera sp. XPORK-15E]MEA5536723.1 sulfotransferase family 2 domain-containing protein [Crocosphaera sp. XPORK-15E]